MRFFHAGNGTELGSADTGSRAVLAVKRGGQVQNHAFARMLQTGTRAYRLRGLVAVSFVRYAAIVKCRQDATSAPSLDFAEGCVKVRYTPMHVQIYLARPKAHD